MVKWNAFFPTVVCKKCHRGVLFFGWWCACCLVPVDDRGEIRISGLNILF